MDTEVGGEVGRMRGEVLELADDALPDECWRLRSEGGVGAGSFGIWKWRAWAADTETAARGVEMVRAAIVGRAGRLMVVRERGGSGGGGGGGRVGLMVVDMCTGAR